MIEDHYYYYYYYYYYYSLLYYYYYKSTDYSDASQSYRGSLKKNDGTVVRSQLYDS